MPVQPGTWGRSKPSPIYPVRTAERRPPTADRRPPSATCRPRPPSADCRAPSAGRDQLGRPHRQSVGGLQDRPSVSGTGGQPSALGSRPSAVGHRPFSSVVRIGSRSDRPSVSGTGGQPSAGGSRPSAVGLRHRRAAIGGRQSALGSRPSAVGHRPFSSVVRIGSRSAAFRIGRRSPVPAGSHRRAAVGHRQSVSGSRSPAIGYRRAAPAHTALATSDWIVDAAHLAVPPPFAAGPPCARPRTPSRRTPRGSRLAPTWAAKTRAGEDQPRQ